MTTTLQRIAYHYNQPQPLIKDLVPMVGSKEEVKIADIGSGPYSVIGQSLEGVKIEVYPSDRHNFEVFWKRWKMTPLKPIEIQDMEKLTYKDKFFDIVTCMNALDHTKNAFASVKEMIRIVKPGGWVYIDCYLDQQKTGHKHYWNVQEDGRLTGPRGEFDLKEFGFNIKYIDKGGLRRHNQIIATYQKK